MPQAKNVQHEYAKSGVEACCRIATVQNTRPMGAGDDEPVADGPPKIQISFVLQAEDSVDVGRMQRVASSVIQKAMRKAGL